MMATEMKQRTIPWHPGIQIRGIIASYTLFGLATPSHAQVCDPVEIVKLLTSDGANEDYFGNAVDIDGDRVIIGVHRDDFNGVDSGSAYIFVRKNNEWVQSAMGFPPGGSARGDRYGISVAISGDTAVVGAYGDDDNGSLSGAAHVLRFLNNQWNLYYKLEAFDGAAGDLFGYSVDIHEETIIVGSYSDDSTNGSASGAAYIFTPIDGSWIIQRKLVASDAAEGDLFGYSVAINGDTALIGSRRDDDNGTNSGSAYVFTRIGNTWTQEAKLLSSDGDAHDRFGFSVSLNNDTALIGAHHDDDLGLDSGSAYVFTRQGTTWTQQAKLLPSDGVLGDQFGESVSLSHNTAIIGAPFTHTNGESSGSAYVFKRTGNTWSQQSKLAPNDGTTGDLFGRSVSIDDTTLVAGAAFDDDNGHNAGSAYIFDLAPTMPADLNADGNLDFFDISAFLQAYNAQDPVADFNDDTVFSFFDISAFLQAFGIGCP